MTNHTWPSPIGPWSGNAWFETLAPKRERVWIASLSLGREERRFVADDTYIVAESHKSGLTCLKSLDGSVHWTLEDWRRRGYECYLAGDYVLTFRGEDPSMDYEVSVVRLSDGERQAIDVGLIPQGIVERAGRPEFVLREATIDLTTLEVVVRDESLFGRMLGSIHYANVAFDTTNGIRRQDATTGEIVWQLPAESPPEEVLAVDSDLLLCFVTTGTFRARSTQDGRLLWEAESKHTWDDVSQPLLLKHQVLHWESRTLTTRDRRTGRIIWEQPFGEFRTNLLGSPEGFWLGAQTPDGRSVLQRRSPESGQILEELALPLPASGYALAVAGTSLLCRCGKKILCFA